MIDRRFLSANGLVAIRLASVSARALARHPNLALRTRYLVEDALAPVALFYHNVLHATGRSDCGLVRIAACAIEH